MRSKVIALLFLTVWSPAAMAHSGHAAAATTDARVTTNAAWSIGSFDFGDTTRGTWQTFSARAAWSPSDWLTGELLVPWGYIRLDDGRGAVGLSDIAGAARVNANGDKWRFGAGLGVGLPTGDTSVGLGAGHFDLTPFVEADFKVNQTFSIAVTAEHQEALDASDDTGVPHGALLAPHANRESRAALAGRARSGRTEVELRGGGVVTHSTPMGGTSAGGAFRVRPNDGCTLTAEVDVPTTGFHRYRWRTGISATFSFN